MAGPDYLDAAYVRLWATLADDRPDVWYDDARLAGYVRLLMAARMAFPASAEYPAGVTDEVRAMLTDEGVVEPVGSRRYRFHGLASLVEAETTNRGRAGGQARAQRGRRDAFGRYRRDAGATLDNAGATTLVRDAGQRWDTTHERGTDDAGGNAGESNAAESAPDDAAPGFYAPGGPTLGFAGDLLVSDAGRPASGTRPREDRRGDTNEPTRLVGDDSTKPPAYAGVPARDPGDLDPGEFDPMPSRSSVPHRADPSAIECTDYKAHQAEHRWHPGIGWKCLVCERAKADVDLTFTEKVERARTRAAEAPDSPF